MKRKINNATLKILRVWLRMGEQALLKTDYLFIQPFYNLQPVCSISVFIEECLRQSSDFFARKRF